MTVWSRWSPVWNADGRTVFRDLRWGVYAVVKAPNDYARTCFKEYGLRLMQAAGTPQCTSLTT